MGVLILGLLLPALAFAAHVARWRRERPKQTGHMLIRLMTAYIGAGWLAAMVVAFVVPSTRSALPADPFAWLHALGLALVLAAAYVMTYPAIEVESPTLLIVEAIASRGGDGIDADELRRRLDDQVLVNPRIDDLVDEGLVTREGGLLAATPRGLALARGFQAWRKILRAPLGG